VATLLISQFSFVLAVKVDGEVIGTVANTQELETLIEVAAQTAQDVLGTPYAVAERISYSRQSPGTTALPPLDTEDAETIALGIFERIENIETRYVISIDGVSVGYVSELTTLRAAMEARLDRLKEEGADSAVFLSDVEFGSELAELGEVLTDLCIIELVDDLTVETVQQVTFTEAVPFSVDIIADDQMFEDIIQILQEGAYGEQQVTVQITYINDLEVRHTILQTKVLTEAIPEIILEGTLERPLTASFGEYIWPTVGTVSSHFGPRRVAIGSSNHQGIDISAPHGTPVIAADGGEVIFTGFSGGFGNLIKILHDNGHVTYYAHLSSIDVSVGERVYQGQFIGRVGMTGTASGNHLHFEIRIDGVPVNPYPWLP